MCIVHYVPNYCTGNFWPYLFAARKGLIMTLTTSANKNRRFIGGDDARGLKWANNPLKFSSTTILPAILDLMEP